MWRDMVARLPDSGRAAKGLIEEIRCIVAGDRDMLGRCLQTAWQTLASWLSYRIVVTDGDVAPGAPGYTLYDVRRA